MSLWNLFFGDVEGCGFRGVFGVFSEEEGYESFK